MKMSERALGMFQDIKNPEEILLMIENFTEGERVLKDFFSVNDKRCISAILDGVSIKEAAKKSYTPPDEIRRMLDYISVRAFAALNPSECKDCSRLEVISKIREQYPDFYKRTPL